MDGNILNFVVAGPWVLGMYAVHVQTLH